MTVFVILLFVAVGGYLASCMVAGMSLSALTLQTFQPEVSLPVRSFRHSQDQVQRAFVDAVSNTGGMQAIDQRSDAILVDSKPTVRIMDGSFGLVLRLDFAEVGAETAVRVSAAQKVGFAFTWSLHAAVREAERTLRKRAKASGIEEIIG